VVIEELLGRPTGGRHALDEDAFQTPIFAALTRGGGRERRQVRRADSLDEFRRDPLTAPIPIQLESVVAPAGQDAGTELARRRAARERSASLAGPRGVTGALIADMTMCAPADVKHRRVPAVHRARSARERSAQRDWPGLDALADTGRHHLQPIAANG
jgi:hypothetical protein